ncbi:hypothetical protein QSJ19_23005 [Gordonia sp. ABSL11-1]|uniref:hypothetical protein n=1 Tax=Gordonia sp. ABSL11-1 TaxID=3053924 RepID=UPI0025744839|nr:hypothetical protein [Gordonia sp. ABSL11-1]MDL9948395.1 hypothetical protein [Gordonia sp. ABSL11-1]
MTVDAPLLPARTPAHRVRSGPVVLVGVIAVAVVGCSPWIITGVDDGERSADIMPVVQTNPSPTACAGGRYLAPSAFTARVMRNLVVDAHHDPLAHTHLRPSSADPSCSP